MITCEKYHSNDTCMTLSFAHSHILSVGKEERERGGEKEREKEREKQREGEGEREKEKREGKEGVYNTTQVKVLSECIAVGHSKPY